jgi:predicted small metal-binding protein
VRSATYTVKSGDVVKSFECRDAGVVCGAKVTGETEEEVLAKAVEHAREVHGVDLTASTTLAKYARGLIHDDAGGTR